ncbi:MAG: hypothetical protein U0694_13715 [Anaerolineae bacterium]
MSQPAARGQRGWRISFGKRRASAARRNAQGEVNNTFLGGYEPLNPDTFGKPRPKPLPFTPQKPNDK